MHLCKVGGQGPPLKDFIQEHRLGDLQEHCNLLVATSPESMSLFAPATMNCSITPGWVGPCERPQWNVDGTSLVRFLHS